jgi:hypothetical protein
MKTAKEMQEQIIIKKETTAKLYRDAARQFIEIHTSKLESQLLDGKTAAIEIGRETCRSSGQNNNAYARLSLGNYNLSFNDGLYTLTASDIFEDSKYSNNEIRYSYSLNVLFDKNNVISVYID